ncbi:hypothetical protein Tco_0309728 [Tanacetum coccineum]
MENYKKVSQDIREQLNAKVEAVQIILTGIDNDIYSTVDACPNACEMWKAIERLKQGESINVQDLETNLYWEFRKFTSRDGESLESSYFNYNQNGKVLTLVKESQELKTVSYHKLYDILKQHQNEVHLVVQKYGIQCYNCKEYGHVIQRMSETETIKRGKLITRKRCYCVNKRKAGVQLNAEQADWKDDTDDESDDQELEAHYMYNAQIQEKLKCEIDDSKNQNKFLESSNKALVDKLKGEIEDFKTKNKSLESSNNHFKEETNELLKNNQLCLKNLKKFQAELDK